MRTRKKLLAEIDDKESVMVETLETFVLQDHSLCIQMRGRHGDQIERGRHDREGGFWKNIQLLEYISIATYTYPHSQHPPYRPSLSTVENHHQPIS
ncbi:hypothetical protein L2E82_52166 [Cichorium intybus]|nr:hypothetical protein L2E82_52166 [Cichorium intybus]